MKKWIPADKAEVEALRGTLRREIDEEQLDGVNGGYRLLFVEPLNDVKPKPDPVIWVCHFCGATVTTRYLSDATKHMTKCPNNPFK